MWRKRVLSRHTQSSSNQGMCGTSFFTKPRPWEAHPLHSLLPSPYLEASWPCSILFYCTLKRNPDKQFKIFTFLFHSSVNIWAKDVTAWQHPHCCALEKTPTLQLLWNVTNKIGLREKQIPGPFLTPTAKGKPGLHEANSACSEKWKLYFRAVFTVSCGLQIKEEQKRIKIFCVCLSTVPERWKN